MRDKYNKNNSNATLSSLKAKQTKSCDQSQTMAEREKFRHSLNEHLSTCGLLVLPKYKMGAARMFELYVYPNGRVYIGHDGSYWHDDYVLITPPDDDELKLLSDAFREGVVNEMDLYN